MRVYLRKKEFAATAPIKKVSLQGNFYDYYMGKDNINERLLLDHLPNNFLPKDCQYIAVMVEDEISKESGRVISNTGQRNLNIFKDYDKYSNKYSLLLCRYE